MNYRDLLRKYITFVGLAEGTDFLAFYGSDAMDAGLSEDEFALLQHLASTDDDSPAELRIMDPGGALLTFRAEGSETPTVVLHRDGSITYGPGYDPDKTARQFWEAMAKLGSVNIQRGAG